MSSYYDQILLNIFLKEKANFFDVIFGFLHRNTDFYDEYGPDKKSALTPGEAERVVVNSFWKWKNMPKFWSPSIELPINHNLNVQTVRRTNDDASMDQEEATSMEPPSSTEVSSGECLAVEEFEVIEEVEVETSVEPQLVDKQICSDGKDKVSDSYNGATRDRYTWSQSINDLDILIKLPPCIKTAKELLVNIQPMYFQIQARIPTVVKSGSRWRSVFAGELLHRIRKNESVWSVVPGKHISIHFEKVCERWWDACLVGEPKIDLSKIDCSRHLDDMGVEEQMKVQELMWNHQQKLLGKPTSEEIRMEKILKKAWNAKGSPFEGTPYDPSVLKFSN